jgi:hypothetical protein
MNPLVVIGIVTMLHGVAHLVPAASAIAQPLTLLRLEGNGVSPGLETPSLAPRAVIAAMFSMCAFGFALGGMAATGSIVPIAWWRPFTDSAAIISTVALITFPHAFPANLNYRFVALAVNVLIIGNWLQIWDWPL